MAPQEAMTNAQKLENSAEHHRWEMQQAVRTVHSSLPDPAARQEVLACLGLLDV